MTDMTTEQALADALDNLVHDNYERSYRGSQERKADADLIRAALSRPADTEASRTLDALIALAAGDDGLPDDMRADVERLRARLSRSAVPAELAEREFAADRQSPGEPEHTLCGLTDLAGQMQPRLERIAPEILKQRAERARAAEQHPDDAAVDRFAQAMKAKLAQARAKGRSGWDDPAQCSPEYLADLLAGHVRKGNDGNFVDVANLAMMLHQRGAAPSVMPDAIRRSAAEESSGDDGEPVYRLTIRDDRSDVIDACPALLDLDPGHYELHARPESAEGDSE